MLVRSALVTALVAASVLLARLPDGSPPSRSPAGACASFAGLPLAFIANAGQWDVDAAYVVRRGALLARVERDALAVQLERGDGAGAVVRMRFAGCASDAALEPGERLPGYYNFFLGADRGRWRAKVPAYDSVTYRGLYDGVDLRLRESVADGQRGALEYDVLVAPGADLGRLVVECEGADGLRLAAGGALVVATAAGDLTMHPPTSWHLGPDGARLPVACRFVLRGPDAFGFDVPDRRAELALVVDPVVEFSTFVGGSGPDWGRDVVLDSQDHAIVTGQMNSPVFPSTPGAYRTTPYGVDDCYVLRVTPDGRQLAWATFVGGTGGDTGWGVALDANDAVIVVGQTGSANFPTTAGAWDTTLSGPQDVFVTRLAPNGAALVYSTFLGGSGRDWGKKVAVDAAGAATVTGHTASSDFPTTAGAAQVAYGGNQDAFVTRLAPNGGSLLWSTYLGGSASDAANNIALGAGGAALVCGTTSSTDFPTTPGAYDTTHNGNEDAFATQVAASGNALTWSTYLGGSENDVANAIAVNRYQVVAVAGRTRSANFPTTPGVFQSALSLNDDAFITQLLVNGSVLGYSTYLGATRQDDIEDLHLESDGVVTATGSSTGGGLSGTPGAFDPSFNGAWDPFIARMEPDGKRRYMTFFGSSNNDNFRAAALDAANVATAVGNSGSTGYPTSAGAFDPTHNGNNDVIITRLDLLPEGVRAFGRSSPGCDGPLAMDVTTVPNIGNAAFALTCTNAPPNTTGYFGLGLRALPAAVTVQGFDLWIDPRPPFFVLPVRSGGQGAARVPAPIPNTAQLVGFKVFTQFVWGGPSAPAPCPPLGASASNALEITFQR